MHVLKSVVTTMLILWVPPALFLLWAWWMWRGICETLRRRRRKKNNVD